MNVSKSKSSIIDGGDLKLIEELRRTIEVQKLELNQLKSSGSTMEFKGLSTSLANNQGSAALKAENLILNEKLEHLSRLTDLQKTETIILKNDILNDLLGSGIDNNTLQFMMANLEEFYKRVNYEMDEHKSYINHLENQLKSSHIQNSQAPQHAKPPTAQTNGIDLDSVLKDQEEEIWHLKELIKDKDHIIKSLTKTSKLRRLMESNSTNITEESDRKPLVRLSESGKENSFNDMKSFKIGGRRSPERD